MASPEKQHDLLLGHLALELNFINADTLAAAKEAWSGQRGKSLGQVLVDRQAISPHTLGVLENLVQLQMAQDASEEYDSPFVDEDATMRGEVPILTPPEDQLAANLVLRFRKLKPHAAGALGQVYLARDRELRRKVALKEIKEHYADNPDARSRFLLEGEITGRLEHPGVVPVYGMGTYANGRPYYAMRFIKGKTLADAIAGLHAPALSTDDRALELRKLLSRFITVCNTMQYAHDRDIVHRDLKPGNIMLGTYGETLVVDWGLAKVMGKVTGDASGSIFEPLPSGSGSSETLPGKAVGTITYMSPEQAAGRTDEVGPGSDVYSLGATLFSILTGRASVEDSTSPDQGKVDIRKLQQKVVHGDIRRPRDLKPDVDRALEAVCAKAMALRPIDRYPTARALAEDVERWLAGEPVTAWPEPVSRRVRRWVGRHRTLISTAAAALVVGFAVTLGFAGVLIDAYGKLEGDFTLLKKYKTDLEAANQGLDHATAALGNAEGAAKIATDNAKAMEEQVDKQRALLIKAQADAKEASKKVDAARSEVESEKKKTTQQLALTAKARDEATEFQRTAKTAETAAKLAGAEEKKARADAVRILAVNNTMLAQNRWNEGQVVLAHELLENIDPKFRLGGWHFLRRQFEGSYATLYGHVGPVRLVSFSPDGRLIASASMGRIDNKDRKQRTPGGTLILWDARTGSTQYALKDVVTFAFGPDGKRLAIAGPDGKIRLADAAKGTVVKTSAILHDEGIASLAFSPDGKRLVLASENGALKWCDANTLENPVPFEKGHTHAVTSLAFSLDGKQLISTGLDKTVLIWNADTLKVASTFMSSTNGIAGASLSPTGLSFATAANTDDTLYVRNLKTGEDRPLRGRHALPPTHVIFSPDGQRLASASFDGTIKIWDAHNGREIQTLQGHTKGVRSISFSPDGQRLASASNDWTVKLWDLTGGQELQSFTGPISSVASLAYCPEDKQRLVAGTWNGTVHIWNGLAAKPSLTIKAHPKEILGVAISADGSIVASGGQDGKVKIWNAINGKELPLNIKGHTATVTSVAFSHDGKRLASVSEDKTIKVWDTKSGIETWSHKQDAKGTNGDLTSVAFSPDGRRLAWADHSGAFNVWDFESKKQIARSEHSNGITRVAFAPTSEYLASAGQDGRVILWDAHLDPVLNLKGHAGGVMSVCFSSDGKRLASASKDGTVKLWDARTGQGITTFVGHRDLVTSVVFSPDGKYLVSASLDKTVKLWDASTAKENLVFKGQHATPVESVSFSANGKKIYSRDEDGKFAAWDAEKGVRLPDDGPEGGTVHSPISPNGKQIAVPVSNWFYLVEVAASKEEEAYRQNMGQPKASWHRERAASLENAKEKQWYAAAFHWTWAAEADPTNEDTRQNLNRTLKLLSPVEAEMLRRHCAPALKR